MELSRLTPTSVDSRNYLFADQFALILTRYFRRDFVMPLPDPTADNLGKQLESSLTTLAAHPNDNFLELTAALELDPRSDFIGADLREMNLAGLDLTGFNFQNTDFRGADLKGAKFTNCCLDGAIFDAAPLAYGHPLTEDNIVVATDGLSESEVMLMQEAANGPKYRQRSRAIRQLARRIRESSTVANFVEARAIDDKAIDTRMVALDCLLRASDSPEATEERILKLTIQSSRESKAVAAAFKRLRGDGPPSPEFVRYVSSVAHKHRVGVLLLVEVLSDKNELEDQLIDIALWSDDYNARNCAILKLSELFSSSPKSKNALRELALGRYNLTHSRRNDPWPFFRAEALESYVKYFQTDPDIASTISQYVDTYEFTIGQEFWKTYIDKYQSLNQIERQIVRKFISSNSSWRKEELFCAYCYLVDGSLGVALFATHEALPWEDSLLDDANQLTQAAKSELPAEFREQADLAADKLRRTISTLARE
jgi:Pentapeptide repeats (8 copies)